MIHLLAASSGTNLDPLYAKALFWILAILAVAAAITMICVRQAVHCALMLAVVMLCLAVMYAMQGAPFLAFVQIIVYTGAVLMLFLFVMMLIGGHSNESLVETIRGQRAWAAPGLWPPAAPPACQGPAGLPGLRWTPRPPASRWPEKTR